MQRSGVAASSSSSSRTQADNIAFRIIGSVESCFKKRQVSQSATECCGCVRYDEEMCVSDSCSFFFFFFFFFFLLLLLL